MYMCANTTTSHQSVSVSVVFSPCLDPGAVREEAVRMVQEELLRATQETARLERERIELERQQQSAVSHD